MAIIRLTKQEFKCIDNTKTGWDNWRLVKEYPILFNTDKVIKILPSEGGGCRISYTEAMVGSMYVKESLNAIEKLISKKSN